MRKLIYIFLSLSLIACEKDDSISQTANNGNNTNSPYTGNWSGIFTGDDEGVWNASISSNGTITGNLTSTAWGTSSTVSGSVTNSGSLSATIGSTSDGATFVGQFDSNSNTGAGIWTSPAISWTGEWTGGKN